jgi:peptide-methionine (S)-S-oxide reductase
LFDIYWSNLDPYYPPYSRQYMSIVFYHNDFQKKIAQERKTLSEEKRGKKVYVEIVPYTKFYMAENYHQKYYLQLRKELFEELLERLGSFTNFVNSTSAAKINGYIKGYGTKKKLLEDITEFDLSERGKDLLLETFNSYGR